MTKIASKLTDLIGNTPLLQLNSFDKSKGVNANIIAKLEYFNPLGSVKDRIAFAMIEDAEAKGLLKPVRSSSSLPLATLASVSLSFQLSRATDSSSPCQRQ